MQTIMEVENRARKIYGDKIAFQSTNDGKYELVDRKQGKVVVLGKGATPSDALTKAIVSELGF